MKAVIQRFKAALARIHKRGEFWKSVPLGSAVLFFIAIFSLFAGLGFLNLMMKTVRLPPWQIVGGVLFSGGFALLFAVTALYKKYIAFLFIIAVQIVFAAKLGPYLRNDVPLVSINSEMAAQLRLLGTGGLFALIIAYTCFLVFSTREGERFFLTHAEMKLARELHQTLVPAVDLTIGGFEIYGASIPSGDVGGDLVDAVTHGDDWTAYVADVSGHGVAPGVLMAMFKASVRSRIIAGCDGASLLEGVHQTLYPLKTSNMFVTAGFLQSHNGRLLLSLAGHPSLIHFRRQAADICEYESADLPIGILPAQRFSSRELDCQPGDVLLLLTDGIMEAANKAGDELGIEPVKAALRENPDAPLSEMFRKIRSLALAFGKQTDDQTMLLVRRMKG
jgi:Stage II sporulation protein E (SpoIIE)